MQYCILAACRTMSKYQLLTRLQCCCKANNNSTSIVNWCVFVSGICFITATYIQMFFVNTQVRSDCWYLHLIMMMVAVFLSATSVAFFINSSFTKQRNIVCKLSCVLVAPQLQSTFLTPVQHKNAQFSTNNRIKRDMKYYHEIIHEYEMVTTYNFRYFHFICRTTFDVLCYQKHKTA